MTIAFVFIFLGLFWPRNHDGWFGALFFTAEIGASATYLLAARRDRKDSERLKRAMHEINEKGSRN
jgi:hypothetical protein